jgi:hypothetical protein
MLKIQAFLNMSPRSACLIDEGFVLVKSKTSSLGTNIHSIRISELIDVKLKDFFFTWQRS